MQALSEPLTACSDIPYQAPLPTLFSAAHITHHSLSSKPTTCCKLTFKSEEQACVFLISLGEKKAVFILLIKVADVLYNIAVCHIFI